MTSKRWKKNSIILSLVVVGAILVVAGVLIFKAYSETEPQEESSIYSFDFEDKTTQSWTGRMGSESVEVTNEAAYESEYSLKVTNRTFSHSGPLVNVDKLIAGKTYQISAWVRLLEGEADATVQLQMQYTKEGETSLEYPYIGGATATNSKWVKLSGKHIMPATAGEVAIYLENNWDGGEEGKYSSFYLDNLEVTLVPEPEPIVIQKDIPSLKDVLTQESRFGADFKIGSSLLHPEIEDVGGELLAKHFNVLTLGNELKWDATEPEEGEFQFASPDKVLAFIEQQKEKGNEIALRGHTLVWHSQTPDWVFYDEGGKAGGKLASKELLYKRMKSHIENVMGRYKGKIYAWDVVNEVMEPSDTQSGLTEHGLRNSLWYQIAGEEYIKKAFEFAHEVDPSAKLYINDYNTEMPDKRDAIYELVKRFNQEWKDEGSEVRIDGVGHQTHISMYGPSMMRLDDMITKFIDLGVEQEITELDMSVYHSDSQAYEELSEEMAIRQAQHYKELFDVFDRNKEHLSSIIFWGKDDANTWLSTFPVVRNNWPLLFDERMQAKYAYWALVDYTKVPEIPTSTE